MAHWLFHPTWLETWNGNFIDCWTFCAVSASETGQFVKTDSLILEWSSLVLHILYWFNFWSCSSCILRQPTQQTCVSETLTLAECAELMTCIWSDFQFLTWVVVYFDNRDFQLGLKVLLCKHWNIAPLYWVRTALLFTYIFNSSKSESSFKILPRLISKVPIGTEFPPRIRKRLSYISI